MNRKSSTGCACPRRRRSRWGRVQRSTRRRCAAARARQVGPSRTVGGVAGGSGGAGTGVASACVTGTCVTRTCGGLTCDTTAGSGSGAAGTAPTLPASGDVDAGARALDSNVSLTRPGRSCGGRSCLRRERIIDTTGRAATEGLGEWRRGARRVPRPGAIPLDAAPARPSHPFLRFAPRARVGACCRRRRSENGVPIGGEPGAAGESRARPGAGAAASPVSNPVPRRFWFWFWCRVGAGPVLVRCRSCGPGRAAQSARRRERGCRTGSGAAAPSTAGATAPGGARRHQVGARRREAGAYAEADRPAGHPGARTRAGVSGAMSRGEHLPMSLIR